MSNYPIGTPGVAWGETEKQQWLNAQTVKRSYQEEVLEKLLNDNQQLKIDTHSKLHNYGSLAIDPKRYPLYALSSKNWQNDKPCVLVTGGVHGYETSGVQGALTFALEHVQEYQDRANFIIAPCLSPWGYETINRWNPDTVDPNRSFYANSPSPEAQLLMDFVSAFLTEKGATNKLLMHIDLHETTDTDDSEFRPALAARDALKFSDWGIPDGFYTVADTQNVQLPFQQAIIEAVRKVTHIAPPDANNHIIGSEVISDGVICYDKKALFLCGGFTDAEYVTTTEVYPDSANATPEQCIAAQVAAIQGGLDYLL